MRSAAARSTVRLHARLFRERRSSIAAAAAAAATLPTPSARALATDDPIIVATKALIARSGRAPEDVASLAQGIVHWQPPTAALEAAARGAADASSSSYGPARGLPELVDALGKRLTEFNGLPEGVYEPMVTAGANQAFGNIVLSCLDASDAAVLFAPYYFNHLMMLTASGIPKENVLVGPRDPAMLPDLDWLEQTLFPSEKDKKDGKKKIPKLVVLVNPCNPTGVVLPKTLLQRASDLCAKAGTWLVVDNTYDHFVYGGIEHEMPLEAPHIIHVSSFSKAYGMAGWRVGWLASHKDSGLSASLLKVQDTVPICAPQLSQRVALAALEGPGAGASWVAERVKGLEGNRAAVKAALAPLDALAAAEEQEETGKESSSALGAAQGAIYLWSRLPASLLRDGKLTDSEIVEWLVKRHGVCLVPGSACGSPGRVRAAFANLEYRECERAAGRLASGVEELLEHAGKEFTMRPRKFQHENSYACLLAEVLEEVDEAGEEKDSTEKHSIKASAARQSFASARRQQRRQISAAAAASSTPSTSTPRPSSSPSLLVERDDESLPEVLKFNPFVQTGYRRAPLSRRQCLASLSYLHNETFNVVSHLVPLLLLSLALASGKLASLTWPQSIESEEDWSLFFHALPVLLCLAGSVAYHLFMADSANYSTYLSIDVCGVLALVVDGTRAMASRPAGCLVAVGAVSGPLALLRELLISPWAAAGPSSLPSLLLSSAFPSSSAALARDAALASYAVLVALAATKVLKGKTAAERGLPLLALLLARFAVLAARVAEVNGLPISDSASSSSLRSSLAWYARAEAASFLGGLVNVLRVPERFARPLPPLERAACCSSARCGEKPEGEKKNSSRLRFVDLALNSHNLMHLLSLLALGCYHAAAAEDRRHWLAHGCGTGAEA